MGDVIDAAARAPSRQHEIEFFPFGEAIEKALDTSPGGRQRCSCGFRLSDGKPKTLEDIGDMHGVTRERIGQIEGEAMPRLRRLLSQGLRVYLD